MCSLSALSALSACLCPLCPCPPLVTLCRRAQTNPGNSTIAFADNSSALRGFAFDALRPREAAAPSPYVTERADYGMFFLLLPIQ